MAVKSAKAASGDVKIEKISVLLELPLKKLLRARAKSSGRSASTEARLILGEKLIGSGYGKAAVS